MDPRKSVFCPCQITVVSFLLGAISVSLGICPANAQETYGLKATPKTVENQTPAASMAAPNEKEPLICVKHLEPPLRYPPLARQTRLGGTIVMKLKIAADGSVLAVQSSPGDSRTVGFGILRDDAEKIVKTWTFGCVGCPPNAPFEHTLRFRYTIDDQDVIQDNRVIMNLPDEITIYTTPVVINPDGQSKNSKKGHQ
jgi:hypothetical protein